MEKDKQSSLGGFFEQKGVTKKINFLAKMLKDSSINYSIEHSGSVKGNTHEKNRSGQSYLYKRLGMESEVFALKLLGSIQGDKLQRALDTALTRYPYFKVKLVPKDGDFYFINNINPVLIKNSAKLRRLGSLQTKGHLIDVTYHQNQIFIAFHHALCDGEGIKPFVETLIYYYCQYRYNTKADSTGIRLANQALLPDETKEPFLSPYEYKPQDFIKLERDGYMLPEITASDDHDDYRFEMVMDAKAFLDLCKENNATPSIMVALLMGKVISSTNQEVAKPIICNSALSMRKALSCPNTFKNCVKSIMFHHTKELAEMPLINQAAAYRQLLDAQRDDNYLKKAANEFISLFEKLDQLPTFEAKQEIMTFFDKMLVNTYFLSYIGKFNFAENVKYVEAIHLYNSGVTGLGINLIATSDKFCLDFKQSFKSDRYFKAFTKLLDDLGIKSKASSAILFKTPTDGIVKRKSVEA